MQVTKDVIPVWLLCCLALHTCPGEGGESGQALWRHGGMVFNNMSGVRPDCAQMAFHTPLQSDQNARLTTSGFGLAHQITMWAGSELGAVHTWELMSWPDRMHKVSLKQHATSMTKMLTRLQCLCQCNVISEDIFFYRFVLCLFYIFFLHVWDPLEMSSSVG